MCTNEDLDYDICQIDNDEPVDQNLYLHTPSCTGTPYEINKVLSRFHSNLSYSIDAPLPNSP